MHSGDPRSLRVEMNGKSLRLAPTSLGVSAGSSLSLRVGRRSRPRYSTDRPSQETRATALRAGLSTLPDALRVQLRSPCTLSPPKRPVYREHGAANRHLKAPTAIRTDSTPPRLCARRRSVRPGRLAAPSTELPLPRAGQWRTRYEASIRTIQRGRSSYEGGTGLRSLRRYTGALPFCGEWFNAESQQRTSSRLRGWSRIRATS
jgi:hypothetical protein